MKTVRIKHTTHNSTSLAFQVAEIFGDLFFGFREDEGTVFGNRNGMAGWDDLGCSG